MFFVEGLDKPEVDHLRIGCTAQLKSGEAEVEVGNLTPELCVFFCYFIKVKYAAPGQT